METMFVKIESRGNESVPELMALVSHVLRNSNVSLVGVVGKTFVKITAIHENDALYTYTNLLGAIGSIDMDYCIPNGNGGWFSCSIIVNEEELHFDAVKFVVL